MTRRRRAERAAARPGPSPARTIAGRAARGDRAGPWRVVRGAAFAAVLAAALGCRGATSDPAPAATPAADAAPARTFADVPVKSLQSDPAAHAGEIFEERFVFFRVWWSRDRARPNQLTTDLPTHFEARIAAAPLYAARIEFPATDDALVERWREGTELCLRVRFLRLHETSRSPVFALVGQGTGCRGTAGRP